MAANRRFVQILGHVFAVHLNAARASFCVSYYAQPAAELAALKIFDASKQYMILNVLGRHDKVKGTFLLDLVQLQIIGVGLALKVWRGQ